MFWVLHAASLKCKIGHHFQLLSPVRHPEGVENIQNAGATTIHAVSTFQIFKGDFGNVIL